MEKSIFKAKILAYWNLILKFMICYINTMKNLNIMNYPKNFMALNYWELFTDNKDGSFTTDDTSILVDFSNNFALEETGNSLSHLDIIYDKDEGKVAMNLYRKEGNYYEYVFADFGKTSVSWVDSFIRKNKLA